MAKSKKVKKAKPIKEESTQPVYTVSIKLGSDKIEGSGVTLLEALRALQKPVKIVTKGFVTVKDDTRSTPVLIYNIPRLRRLFYPMAQPQWAKQLNQLMK